MKHISSGNRLLIIFSKLSNFERLIFICRDITFPMAETFLSVLPA